MHGQLKESDFYIGDRNTYSVPRGKIVMILDIENHPIYGKRYRIAGYKEWFEENCFDWVKE